MSGLSLPGSSGPTGNPLVVLNAHLATLNTNLAMITQHIVGKDRPHVAAVAPLTHTLDDGPEWGVFCFACTEEASEFVYPCRILHNQLGFPPQNLWERTQ